MLVALVGVERLAELVVSKRNAAWITALVFSVANAVLLRVRIRTEDAALSSLPSPADAPGAEVRGA